MSTKMDKTTEDEKRARYHIDFKGITNKTQNLGKTHAALQKLSKKFGSMGKGQYLQWDKTEGGTITLTAEQLKATNEKFRKDLTTDIKEHFRYYKEKPRTLGASSKQ